MKIEFLGTCSAVPTRDRNVSSQVLSLDDGSAWMVDCGEGTQQQLMFRGGQTKMGRLKKIFITHMHGDHVFGLPGLMCSMGMTGAAGAAPASGSEEGVVMQQEECEGAPSEGSFNGRVLELYGPWGLGRFVRHTLLMSESYMPYQFRIHELVPPELALAQTAEELEEKWSADTLHPCELRGRLVFQSEEDGMWHLFYEGGITARAGFIVHKVPALGFVFQEDHFPGSLNIQRCRELGVPNGPLLGKLKNGMAITLEDGREVTPDAVVGSPVPGRKIVILGDTQDPYAIAEACFQCHVLVHECTFDAHSKEMALDRGHSTSEMAGEFARAVSARKLVLNHFSARFSGEAAKEEVNKLRLQAQEAFGGGDVVTAEDFSVVDIPKPK